MPDFSSAIQYVPTDFPELRRKVADAGLFEKQPVYFTLQWIAASLLLAFGISVLFLFDSWVVQMFNAVFFAFVFVQFGFLLHDSGHHQVFHSAKWNTRTAYLTSLVLGGSAAYWVHKHNEHHAHPNHEEMDPDVDVYIIAFSEKQAREKKGFCRWVVTHQHWFFFPVLCLVSLTLRMSSVSFVRNHPLKEVWLDVLMMILHAAWYLGVIFYALPPAMGIAFLLVHQLLFGLYMGSVFAPNHKGMMTLTGDVKIDFLREQVLTARNIRAHPLTDFFYGGLNYQVEHHLFPHMPRNQLRKAHIIVKDFCAMKGIPYHETSIIQSYREILESLKYISQFARVPRLQDLRSQLLAHVQHLDQQIQSKLESRMSDILAHDDPERLQRAAERVAAIRASLSEANTLRKARLQGYMQEVRELASSCTLTLAAEKASAK